MILRIPLQELIDELFVTVFLIFQFKIKQGNLHEGCGFSTKNPQST